MELLLQVSRFLAVSLLRVLSCTCVHEASSILARRRATNQLSHRCGQQVLKSGWALETLCWSLLSMDCLIESPWTMIFRIQFLWAPIGQPGHWLLEIAWSQTCLQTSGSNRARPWLSHLCLGDWPSCSQADSDLHISGPHPFARVQQNSSSLPRLLFAFHSPWNVHSQYFQDVLDLIVLLLLVSSSSSIHFVLSSSPYS